MNIWGCHTIIDHQNNNLWKYCITKQVCPNFWRIKYPKTNKYPSNSISGSKYWSNSRVPVSTPSYRWYPVRLAQERVLRYHLIDSQSWWFKALFGRFVECNQRRTCIARAKSYTKYQAYDIPGRATWYSPLLYKSFLVINISSKLSWPPVILIPDVLTLWSMQIAISLSWISDG